MLQTLESDSSALFTKPFSGWMAELDAVQALRMHDPAKALDQVRVLCGQWRGLSSAQDALLHARCGLQTGTALMMLGRHDEAEAAVLALEKQLQSPLLQGAQIEPELRQHAQRCAVSCANARATLAHSKGDFGGALRAYQHALDLARAVGDRRFEAHVLVNLANAFEEAGLPAESLENSRQALGLAQALGMEELVGDIHHNMGNALAAAGQVEAGLRSNQRALQNYEQLGLRQKCGYALVAIAERLMELGRLNDADQALRQRSADPGQFANPQYEAYSAYLRGRIANARADGNAARRAFAQALAATEEQLGDVVGQARSHIELAKLALSESQFDIAQRHAQRALSLLQGSQAQRDLMKAHSLLSQIAKAQGDLAQALSHHEAFHATYERCFNEEAARRAALLAVRHEVDLARADAQRQRLENARLTDALAAISERWRSEQPPLPGSLSRPEHLATRQPADGSPACAEDLEGLGLTPREAEVLFWVTQGKTNEDVTLILDVGLSAVKKHLMRIYSKLGVENRTAAANAVRRRHSRT
jgi:ATP/maltotriose-dependent transcriptional regulator MalT